MVGLNACVSVLPHGMDMYKNIALNNVPSSHVMS